MQMSAGMELLGGTDRHRVSLAIKQALTNALYRGNLELTQSQWQESADEGSNPDAGMWRERISQKPYSNRKIHYDARLMRDLLRIVIRDDGPGFNVREMTRSFEAGELLTSKGRGLMLIHSFMDKVSYNDKGNEITMIKYCRPA
jgi:Histidine kinase-like ATPase domain